MSEATDGTHPDIPDESWDNPFTPGTFLHERFDEILDQNRDLVIILDDHRARRGTGKTVASLQLANGMDQTEEGVTWSKATLRPEEIRNAYAQEEIRSGIVFDEAEFGASNRDAMTNTNKALREVMSMARVEEKYVIINAPTRWFIDKDLQKLADVWISMVRKGLAIVHELKWEPYSQQLLTPQKQWIEFEDVPTNTELRDVYNRLTREKRDAIDGDGGGTEYISVEEHEEQVEKKLEKARRQARNEAIQSIYNHPEAQAKGITQKIIGEAVDLTPQQISNIT